EYYLESIASGYFRLRFGLGFWVFWHLGVFRYFWFLMRIFILRRLRSNIHLNCVSQNTPCKLGLTILVSIGEAVCGHQVSSSFFLNLAHNVRSLTNNKLRAGDNCIDSEVVQIGVLDELHLERLCPTNVL